MAKFFVMAAAIMLSACGPQMTHEQIKAVTDACHSARMEYKVNSNQITCWTIEGAAMSTPNKGESK